MSKVRFLKPNLKKAERRLELLRELSNGIWKKTPNFSNEIHKFVNFLFTEQDNIVKALRTKGCLTTTKKGMITDGNYYGKSLGLA